MDIGELLAFGVRNGASDLHLSAGLPPMIRVDGDLHRIDVPGLGHETVRDLVAGVMNEGQRKDYEDRLETDFSFEVPGLARFRVNAFNHHRGSGAVFRTIPSRVLSLEELHAPGIFKTISDTPRGVVLVTGPTGSGKSTTLAAMIDYKNQSEHGHILTIEDPIEFVHQSKQCLVSQREVHRHTLGFNEALRSALREDPDVILVGEMRDLETIRLALSAAETGHLVFGTLHTSSAAKTIDRIVDVFPAAEKDMVRAMLSESLKAVISQTLLKKNGGGRVAAHEIMIGTPAIRNLIRENRIAQMYSAIQTGQQLGMRTLDQGPVGAGPQRGGIPRSGAAGRREQGRHLNPGQGPRHCMRNSGSVRCRGTSQPGRGVVVPPLRHLQDGTGPDVGRGPSMPGPRSGGPAGRRCLHHAADPVLQPQLPCPHDRREGRRSDRRPPAAAALEPAVLRGARVENAAEIGGGEACPFPHSRE